MNSPNSTEEAIHNPQAARQARGAALRSARALAGLSAQALVDRVNGRTRGSDLTLHAIYSYEKGRVLLGRDAAERIAEVLKVPVGELLVGDPDFAGSATQPDAAGEASPGGGAGADRLRMARQVLLDHAELLQESAQVLRRQLERARAGSTKAGDFVASFNLVMDDARQVIDSPTAGWVLRADRAEGYDTLHELITAARELHEVVDERSMQMFDTQSSQPAAVVRDCHALAEQLAQRLELLKTATGASERLFAE